MSLPGNDVFCIIKDTNGNIWLGTNKGLALYNAANENFITFKKTRMTSMTLYAVVYYLSAN